MKIIEIFRTTFKTVWCIYVGFLAVVSLGAYSNKLFGDAERNEQMANKLWLAESSHGFELFFNWIKSWFTKG